MMESNKLPCGLAVIIFWLWPLGRDVLVMGTSRAQTADFNFVASYQFR